VRPGIYKRKNSPGKKNRRKGRAREKTKLGGQGKRNRESWAKDAWEGKKSFKS